MITGQIKSQIDQIWETFLRGMVELQKMLAHG